MTAITGISERPAGRRGDPSDPFAAFPISGRAYQTLAALVYEHSRIRLGPDRKSMLANRLQKRLRALGLASYEEYCALLDSRDGPDEIEHLVDLISTNHTKFFREPDHFVLLTSRILPELAPRLIAERCPLRIWSAASSSGEEAYTLAIVLAEHFRSHPPLEWHVEASDISQRVLGHARRGIYRMEAVESLPPDLIKRYFQRGVGVRIGTCRVKPELASRVRFQRINLFQADYPIPPGQHVIFCRNVMIYFDTASRATVVQQLTRQLAPGGYLVVGHSENLLGIRHDLVSIRQGIYRRP